MTTQQPPFLQWLLEISKRPSSLSYVYLSSWWQTCVPLSEDLVKILCDMSCHINANLICQCCHANRETKSLAVLVQLLWTKTLLWWCECEDVRVWWCVRIMKNMLSSETTTPSFSPMLLPFLSPSPPPPPIPPLPSFSPPSLPAAVVCTLLAWVPVYVLCRTLDHPSPRSPSYPALDPHPLQQLWRGEEGREGAGKRRGKRRGKRKGKRRKGRGEGRGGREGEQGERGERREKGEREKRWLGSDDFQTVPTTSASLQWHHRKPMFTRLKLRQNRKHSINDTCDLKWISLPLPSPPPHKECDNTINNFNSYNNRLIGNLPPVGTPFKAGDETTVRLPNSDTNIILLWTVSLPAGWFQ